MVWIKFLRTKLTWFFHLSFFMDVLFMHWFVFNTWEINLTSFFAMKMPPPPSWYTKLIFTHDFSEHNSIRVLIDTHCSNLRVWAAVRLSSFKKVTIAWFVNGIHLTGRGTPSTSKLRPDRCCHTTTAAHFTYRAIVQGYCDKERKLDIFTKM